MRFNGLFVLRFSDFWVWGCARRIPAILVIIQPIAEQKYYVGAFSLHEWLAKLWSLLGPSYNTAPII